MTSTADDLARFASAFFAGTLIKSTTRREMLAPAITIPTLHQFFLKLGEPEGTEGRAVGLAYGLGWGLLTQHSVRAGVFQRGPRRWRAKLHDLFERRQTCMIILTNSDNGELAFRPLLESILGDTVTPWEWRATPPRTLNSRARTGTDYRSSALGDG